MEERICEIQREQFEWIKSQLELRKYGSINEVVKTALVELINKEKQPRTIPKERMAEGIDVCRENVLNFLKCAEILVQEKMSNYGVILFQYAKEEIGKLAMLRESANQSGDMVTIPDETFTNHIRKDRVSEKLLGEDAWLVKGGFESPHGIGFQIINQFNGFEKPTRTNHEIRLKCAFVDYDEGQKKWSYGIEHNPETLLAKVREVKEKIGELRL